MSNKEIKEEIAPTKTAWTSEDEEVLVSTLLEEKKKGNWGDNNPKKTAWVACEKALKDSEKVTKSCRKDVASIKSCWQRVSVSPVVESMHTQGYMQLKQSYDRVKHIRNQCYARTLRIVNNRLDYLLGVIESTFNDIKVAQLR